MTETDPTPPRPGRLRWAVAAVVLVAVLLGFALWQRDASPRVTQSPTAPVERGPLTISVVESGTVRPRQQIILRNEMDNDATIVSIVKEGTLVKQGDLLVELDATLLENDRAERRIRVQNSEATLVFAQENFGVVTNQAQADIDQAELQLRFAKQDFEKYLRGEYPKQIKVLESKITLSEEELGQAREQLRWSQILFKEKYLSQSDLQQDELAAKRTQLNVEMAREDLTLATNYTHLRQLAQLQSNVKQAEMALERARRKASANMAQASAELRAREASHEVEKSRLARTESEITKTRIVAPIAGMVLYASSVSDNWDDDEPRINDGVAVDERGEIIYLPTADAFNVDIKVPEVNLTKIKAGLPARILVDALPGRSLAGKVVSIAPLPDSQSRFLNPNLKLYNTVLEVDPGQVALRNGMSCQVDIIVEQFADALYVPIQAVVQQDRQPVVYVVEGGEFKRTPVELGLDNNRVVQILSGLQIGQSVLLTPPLGSERKPAAEPGDKPKPLAAVAEHKTPGTAAPQK